MARWIATTTDHFEALDAVIVEADDVETAGAYALEALEDARTDGGGEPIRTLFVAAWDGRVAFVPRPAVERAEFQCCGGPAKDYHGAGGHWAMCPERPHGTGQPREGEEQPREMDAVQQVTLHVMQHHSHVAVACESVEEAKGIAKSYVERGEAAPFAIAIGDRVALFLPEGGHVEGNWRRPLAGDMENVKRMTDGQLHLRDPGAEEPAL